MMSTVLLVCLLLMLFIFGTLYILIYVFSTEMPSFKLIRKTFQRDIKALFILLKIQYHIKKFDLLNYSLSDLFSLTAKKYAKNVCFVFEDEEWTFQRVSEFSNRVANAFRDLGYKKGDEVALVMENCPEYVCIWLGLSKIGVVTALINTNVREDAFGHSVNILDIKAIIFGHTFSTVIEEAIPFLKNKDTLEYYHYSDKEYTNAALSSKSLNSLLDGASVKDVDLGSQKLGFSDKILYIYTSGTTGLPKAAVIRNSRYLYYCVVANCVCQLDYETYYNPLPLYHSAGGMMFMGSVLVFGGKMILRKKFSASNFWKDVVKYKVTVSQYIGEICRYLLNQPKIAEETQHNLRVLFGNGLRPHIWQEFQERFKIQKIVEIYGSTEGNSGLVNFFGKVGAVGIIPKTFDLLYPVCLMKVNKETGELLRDEKGLAIRCKTGEPGELVGKILSNPLNSFDGYANKIETNKKIFRNCFKHGDTVFLSGDILVMDEEGYLYFLDRTGDTFRWKGENVSTGEVENIVSKVLNHVACVVYGVEIPNTEGRAGMAAIQMDTDKIDLSYLYRELKRKLPAYAVPIFLRISSILESTGTYKLRKVTLQKEGFNPMEMSDPLFLLDHKQANYIPFSKQLYSDISNGKLKV